MRILYAKGLIWLMGHARSERVKVWAATRALDAVYGKPNPHLDPDLRARAIVALPTSQAFFRGRKR